MNIQPKHLLIALLTITLVLLSNKMYSQVSSPKSVAFNPIATNKKQIVQSQTINIDPSQNYQPPMGMSADDVIRQANYQMMQHMGFSPPVIPPSDPIERHKFIIEGYKKSMESKGARQRAMVQEILNEDMPTIEQLETAERLKLTAHYRKAFSEIQKMQQDSVPFSLKRAVYLIENAYFDNTLPYSDYAKNIKIKTDGLKVLMKREKILPSNNLGKNYLIQKLYSEKVVEYKDGKVSRVHKPYQYDFEDYTGESDWTKMFVSKLLATGTGQCHSLPLLYLILAEETNTKAWLSLAPEHSFIVFSDNAKKTFYNYETTNGNSVSYDWMMESGYINTQAIQNHIYLDTLSKDGLIATLLADLVMGYTAKFGYDTFIETVSDEIIRIKPSSLQGQMLRADIMTLIAKAETKRNGNPPLEQFQLYPNLYKAYTQLMKQYDLIDNLGYVKMPKEKYEWWLSSLNDAKHTQEKQALKTKIKNDVKTTN